MNRRAVTMIERAVSRVLRGASVGSGQTILAALSGGPDSVALLHALMGLRDRFGYRLAGAHLNHGIRGEEANRDECFVRAVCERFTIELTVERADGLVAGSSNLEERAREKRHAFLNRTADRIGAGKIALAHHADDQAETVLLRLMRGSGIAGLGAMREVGPGRLIRPMLSIHRGEIIAYLDAIGAEYVTDSSNSSRAHLRNRIRDELIPVLERDYAPNLSRRLAGLASEMRAAADHIAAESGRELDRRLAAPERLNLEGLVRLDDALVNGILREWLRRRIGDLRRIDRDDIERMRRLCFDPAPSGWVALPRGWRLRREYAATVLEPMPTAQSFDYAVPLNLEGLTIVEQSGVELQAEIHRRGDALFPQAPWKVATPLEALFDLDQLPERLIVRNFRRGDRIGPLGTTGTRKLHDVFIDRKVPRERRASWPMVVGGDEILWVPQLVRSRSAVVSSVTQRVFHLRAHWREAR